MSFAKTGLTTTALVALAAFVSLPFGCASDSSSSTSSSTKTADVSMDQKATDTIVRIKSIDPGMTTKFFDTALGYAVFPKITSGAFIVGGSHGDGVLYEGGRITGDLDISSGTLGAQIGGQSISEIIFFKSPDELKRFKEGKFEFDMRASAVAVRTGGSAASDYDHGVAVFTFGEAGLMAQAAVGGQKFKYMPR